MLCDEDGVTPIGRLLAVLVRLRRCEPLRDQLLGMAANCLRAAQLRDRSVTPAQPEPAPKGLYGKPAQPGVEIVSRH